MTRTIRVTLNVHTLNAMVEPIAVLEISKMVQSYTDDRDEIDTIHQREKEQKGILYIR